MSEVLTEKPADTAEPIDTATATTENNENGETHLADGTLLEEMKKALKQSAFAFFCYRSSSCSLFFGVSLSKKVEFYFADANLPYDKCTNFLVFSSLFSLLNEWFSLTGLCGPYTRKIQNTGFRFRLLHPSNGCASLVLVALNGSPMPYGSAISCKWMRQEQKFDGRLNLNHQKINLKGAFMPYVGFSIANYFFNKKTYIVLCYHYLERFR